MKNPYKENEWKDYIHNMVIISIERSKQNG